jgi:hypothetical protein
MHYALLLLMHIFAMLRPVSSNKGLEEMDWEGFHHPSCSMALAPSDFSLIGLQKELKSRSSSMSIIFLWRLWKTMQLNVQNSYSDGNVWNCGG